MKIRFTEDYEFEFDGKLRHAKAGQVVGGDREDYIKELRKAIKAGAAFDVNKAPSKEKKYKDFKEEADKQE